MTEAEAGGEPPDAAAPPPARTPAAVRAAMDHYARTRERIDRTAAGHLQRRVVEIDLIHQSMILAAMAFMLFVPALVSLLAVVPLGAETGPATDIAARLGLSPEATSAVQQLFPGPDTVRGATTAFGVAITVVSAFTWPLALQRGYELAWGLPSLGLSDLWRPLLWLATFIVAATAWAGSGPLITDWVRGVVLVVVGLPLAIGWSWWTQHLLLGRRVGWRLLLPGAIAMGVGLVGLRLAAALFLSSSITQQYQLYGPLGIVFALLSWLIAFSVVMLGGALVGVVLYEHRLRRPPGGPRR